MKPLIVQATENSEGLEHAINLDKVVRLSIEKKALILKLYFSTDENDYITFRGPVSLDIYDRALEIMNAR